MQRIFGFGRSVWRNRRRCNDDPRYLTHIVTFSCNARCIMCDSWKKPGRDDLSLPEIERIYRSLPRLDAVRLTGGEPFVRKDLLEIAHLAQSELKPLALHITTNGFLTDRIVRFCEQRKKTVPLAVLVSVDGVGEKHNEVRGKKSAWDTTIRTVRELARRRSDLRIRLAVNQTVVDDDGVEHYRRLREILRPLGVNNQVVIAYDASATYSLSPDLDVAPIQPGQFKTFSKLSHRKTLQLLDEVEADLASYPIPERAAKRYYLDGIRNRLVHGLGAPNPPCVALNTHLRIFPNGDVPTCQFNTKVVGNLRKQSFAEVWRSIKAEEQREWVRACPGCWAECEVLPSAIYTGDLLSHSLRRGRPPSGEIGPDTPAKRTKESPLRANQAAPHFLEVLQ